jgi:uncharacterized protein DUF4124
MRKGHLVALLLLLISALAVADTYKWVDDSGEVHYGDSPPPEVNTQTVIIPKGPSQKDIERQQQQIKELVEKHEEERLLEPSIKPQQTRQFHPTFPNDAACFSPITDLVHSPSAEYFTPISPSSLAKKEQETLKDLLAKIKSRGTWRGVLFEVECWGQSSVRNAPPISKYKDIDIDMSTDWDKSESLLTLNFKITNGPNLIYRLAVDDFLYFNELRQSNITARDDNKVELLTLQQDWVSFFIKRYVPNRSHRRFSFNHHGTRLRGEIRYIEVSDRNLKLVELYYYDGILASSRTWFLSRANKT